MNRLTDQQLLRDYAGRRSEAAFAELVRRHVDFVYSAALRMVRDPHQAEDVSQAVFLALARNAGQLLDRPVLSGWLHRTTQNLAANVVRSDVRRRAREQEAVAMNELLATGPDASWEHIAPQLDDALGELSESERDALLLRYFERKSAHEIAQTLGVSDDAAQKRVSRAVERLRELFAKRGITVGAGGLVVVLCANAVQAAPAGLAATLARGSLLAAATSAGTTSTLGILTLMSSAKLTTAVATLVVLLLVGGAVVQIIRANRTEIPVPPPKLTAGADTRTINEPKITPATRPAEGAKPDPDVTIALARVQAVLDNPHPGMNQPNPDMVAAIAALGDHRSAAIPMLREALKSGLPIVRQQAAEGLGLIGSDAKEAVPDLVAMLRNSAGNYDAVLSLRALKAIGPSPEILGDLAQILRDNWLTRREIAMAVPDMFRDQLSAVDGAFRPLLQDDDLGVRRSAAYALSLALSDHAGPDVIRVAIEALNASANDLQANAHAPTDAQDRNRQIRDQNLLAQALNTLAKAGQDPNDPLQHVTAASLGSASSDAAAALVKIIKNSSSDDTREAALRLLDRLQPDLQEEPTVAALLQDYQQRTAFAQRANEGQATVPELITGLKQSPNTIVVAAGALSRLGADAQAALPNLREALAALEPGPNLSDAARTEAFRARDAVAKAIQKIAPDQPKPLFTLMDVNSILDVINDPKTTQQDEDRRDKIMAAIGPVRQQMNDQGLACTPDQMRRLLDAVKQTDPSAYSIIAAQVAIIDPQFFAATAH